MVDKLKITRIWASASKHTFTIKPIKELIAKYVETGNGWIDPFAGLNSLAEITNDLNPENNTKFCMDALEFLKQFDDNSFVGAFYDPPYSFRQASEVYKSFGKEKFKPEITRMDYWAGCRNELARILKPQSIVICCGWNSMGLGIKRGFEMLEIMIVPHGGNRNDTIVTVERKQKNGLW